LRKESSRGDGICVRNPQPKTTISI
jgi:hypothetical protein